MWLHIYSGRRTSILSDTLNDCMCVHAHSMKDGKAVFPSELFKDKEEDGAGPSLPPALAPPTPAKPKTDEEEVNLEDEEAGVRQARDSSMDSDLSAPSDEDDEGDADATLASLFDLLTCMILSVPK